MLDKHSNYAYACTRVKAKKPALLTPDTYVKLSLMGVPEISRFIGETQYKREIDELAQKFSGINLIEVATYTNLARTYKQIIGFCTGELKDIVSIYLKRLDVWNLKTILRGKFSNAKSEEILEDIVPAGVFKMDFYIKLIGLATIDEIIDCLKGTEYHKPLLEVRKRIEQITSLLPFENALDKTYYSYLLETVQPTSKANVLFLKFLKKEIDVVNLITLFKLKFEGIKKEKIPEFLLKGGMELTDIELKKLVETDSFDSFVTELRSYGFYIDIKEAVENIAATNSLNDTIRALEKHLLRQTERFSKLYPLSVLPVLHYIIAKKVEVDNIRIVARGVESKLSTETIRNLLVI